jgi:hypothetical protein
MYESAILLVLFYCSWMLINYVYCTSKVIWKLQPTSGELEFDLVKELMEEQYVEMELLRTQRCSTLFPIVNVSPLLLIN